MAAHTANAGAIYFAAGTPDPSDIIGKRVDLTASVWRELQEETGLTRADVEPAASWTLVYAPPRIACMKIMQLRQTAREVQARVEHWLDADPKAELARMHVVADATAIDAARMPGFIVDFLRHSFGG